MFRWLSLTKVLIVAAFGFGAFVAVRDGWISIDVEVGGTRTGTLPDSAKRSNDRPENAASPLGPIPEFEANTATPPFENADQSREQRVDGDLDSVTNRPAERHDVSGIIQSSDEQPARATQTTPKEQTAEFTDPPVRIARRPNEPESKLDLTSIDAQIKAGQLVEAHKELSKLFWQQPELRSRIQERIDATAKAIYFSPQPHVQEPYVIQAGDQLRKVAGQHHVPWQYLSKLNRIDPRRIREGQKLKVIDGPFGAVVTLSDFEVVLHLNGRFVRRYRACIGKDDSTPVGKFKVLNKVTSPQYTDPDGRVFAGTDLKNPLGSNWIDLGESYGIHGTIEPESIGKAESRGCIRLLNADVAEVFDMLDLGSEVIIRR